MRKYWYIVVAASLISCTSNASLPDNVHVASTTSNQIKVSPTAEPSQELPVAPDENKIDWKGKADGYSFIWNGSDIIVESKGGRKQGVFSRIATNYCQAEQTGTGRDCYCGHSFRLASVVGRILSIDHEVSFSCQGSYLSWRYASFDLGKPGDYVYPSLAEFNAAKPIRPTPGKIISLKNLFSEDEILTGLLANSEIAEAVAEAIREKKMALPPQRLEEFNEYFARADSTILEGLFYLEKDYLSRFVFHHTDNSKVAIWISLTPTSHTGHANQRQIEIFLPIPENIREALLLADSGEEGFLMKDARKYVGTSYARFEFDGKDSR